MPKVKRLSCSNFKKGRNVGTLSGLLDAGGSTIEGPYELESPYQLDPDDVPLEGLETSCDHEGRNDVIIPGFQEIAAPFQKDAAADAIKCHCRERRAGDSQ
jgi:hypothetical protein